MNSARESEFDQTLLTFFGSARGKHTTNTDMRHIVIISNPKSGRGRSDREQISRMLEQEKSLTFEFLDTTAAGEAVRTGVFVPGSASFLAHQAAEAGADVVAAAGGDGTLGELANGLLGTNSILGVLPFGTGNDFSRAIGVGTDVELAIKTLIHGKPQTIDVGKCGAGHFINIAGCGFDAFVAERINQGFKLLRGTTAYLAATLQTLSSYRAQDVEIEVDGHVHHEKIMLCAVANATSYGGGMRIAPGASLNDGLFDIVVVGEVSKLEFLKTFPKVFKGAHLGHPKIKVIQGAEVKVRSASSLPVLADGEMLGQPPMTFTVLPEALTVMFPA